MANKASQTAPAAPKGKVAAQSGPGASRVERPRPERVHAAAGARWGERGAWERDSFGGGQEAPRAPVTDPERAAYEYVLRHNGEPLDTFDRAFFEPRLGRVLPDVRVHRDSAAAESAARLGALAWSAGRHVVLGRSMPSLRSSEGRAVLAHELVHVLQHEATGRPLSSLRVGTEASDGAAERQAERLAATVLVAGESARGFVPTSRGALIARFTQPTRGIRAQQPRIGIEPLNASPDTTTPQHGAQHGVIVPHLPGAATLRNLGFQRTAIGRDGEETWSDPEGRQLSTSGSALRVSMLNAVFRVEFHGEQCSAPAFEELNLLADPREQLLFLAIRRCVVAAGRLAGTGFSIAEINALLRRAWGAAPRNLRDGSVGDAVTIVVDAVTGLEQSSTPAFSAVVRRRIIASVVSHIFHRARSSEAASALARVFQSVLRSAPPARMASVLADESLDVGVIFLLATPRAPQSDAALSQSVELFARTTGLWIRESATWSGDAPSQALSLFIIHLDYLVDSLQFLRLQAAVLGAAPDGALADLGSVVRQARVGALSFIEARDRLDALRVTATQAPSDRGSGPGDGTMRLLVPAVRGMFEALANRVWVAPGRAAALRTALALRAAAGADILAIYEAPAGNGPPAQVTVRAPSAQRSALINDLQRATPLVAFAVDGHLFTRVVGGEDAGLDGVGGESDIDPLLDALQRPPDAALAEEHAANLRRLFAATMRAPVERHYGRILDVLRQDNVDYDWPLRMLLRAGGGDTAGVASFLRDVLDLSPDDANSLAAMAVVGEGLFRGATESSNITLTMAPLGMAPANSDATPTAPASADATPTNTAQPAPTDAQLRRAVNGIVGAPSFAALRSAVASTIARVSRDRAGLPAESLDASCAARLWARFPELHEEFLQAFGFDLPSDVPVALLEPHNLAERAFLQSIAAPSLEPPEPTSAVLAPGLAHPHIATAEENESLSAGEVAQRLHDLLLPAVLALPSVLRERGGDQIAGHLTTILDEFAQLLRRTERLRARLAGGPGTQLDAALREYERALEDMLYRDVSVRSVSSQLTTVAERLPRGANPDQDTVAVRGILDDSCAALRQLAMHVAFVPDRGAALQLAQHWSRTEDGVAFVAVFSVAGENPDLPRHALVACGPFTRRHLESELELSEGLLAIASEGQIQTQVDRTVPTEAGEASLTLRRAWNAPATSTPVPEQEANPLFPVFASRMKRVLRQKIGTAASHLDALAHGGLALTLVLTCDSSGEEQLYTILNQHADLRRSHRNLLVTRVRDMVRTTTGGARRLSALEVPPLVRRVRSDPHYQDAERTAGRHAERLRDQFDEIVGRRSDRTLVAELWSDFDQVQPAFANALGIELRAGAGPDPFDAHSMAEQVFFEGLRAEAAAQERDQWVTAAAMIAASAAITVFTGGAGVWAVFQLAMGLVPAAQGLYEATSRVSDAEAQQAGGLASEARVEQARLELDSAAVNAFFAVASGPLTSLLGGSGALREILNDAVIDVASTVLDPAFWQMSRDEQVAALETNLVMSFVGNVANSAGGALHEHFVAGQDVHLGMTPNGEVVLTSGDGAAVSGRVEGRTGDGMLTVRTHDGATIDVQIRRGASAEETRRGRQAPTTREDRRRRRLRRRDANNEHRRQMATSAEHERVAREGRAFESDAREVPHSNFTSTQNAYDDGTPMGRRENLTEAQLAAPIASVVALFDGACRVDGERSVVFTVNGREVRVRVELASLPPDKVASHSYADALKKSQKDGTSPPSEAVVYVAHTARSVDLRRAIAHEFAEIHSLMENPLRRSNRALEDNGNPVTRDGVHHHDFGRTMEFRILLDDLANAGADPILRERAMNEIAELAWTMRFDWNNLQPRDRIVLGRELAGQLEAVMRPPTPYALDGPRLRGQIRLNFVGVSDLPGMLWRVAYARDALNSERREMARIRSGLPEGSGRNRRLKAEEALLTRHIARLNEMLAAVSHDPRDAQASYSELTRALVAYGRDYSIPFLSSRQAAGLEGHAYDGEIYSVMVDLARGIQAERSAPEVHARLATLGVDSVGNRLHEAYARYEEARRIAETVYEQAGVSSSADAYAAVFDAIRNHRTEFQFAGHDLFIAGPPGYYVFPVSLQAHYLNPATRKYASHLIAYNAYPHSEETVHSLRQIALGAAPRDEFQAAVFVAAMGAESYRNPVADLTNRLSLGDPNNHDTAFSLPRDTPWAPQGQVGALPMAGGGTVGDSADPLLRDRLPVSPSGMTPAARVTDREVDIFKAYFEQARGESLNAFIARMEGGRQGTSGPAMSQATRDSIMDIMRRFLHTRGVGQ